ncbi:MAG: hypothetical protein AAFR96_01055, partial [Planctomycetota bacterium]
AAGPNRAPAPAVVLADRSPVVPRLLAGEPVGIAENSPNHAGRGQHMLHGDGSVRWSDRPYTLYGDHIYLPRSIEKLLAEAARRGRISIESVPPPLDRADVFLGP